MNEYEKPNSGAVTGSESVYGTSSATGQKSSEELRRDIEKTRSEIGQDLEAIGEKFTPEHIKDQAREQIQNAKEAITEGARAKIQHAKEAVTDTARDAANTISDAASSISTGARRAGSGFVSTIRENPIPAALAGIGITWLLVETVRRARSNGTYDSDSYVGYYPPRAGGYTDSLAADEMYTGVEGGERTGSHRIGDMASSARDRVTQGVSHARERVTEGVSHARERVQELGSDVSDRARQIGQRARYQGQRVGRQARDFAEANPLAVTALACAAGVAIGLLLPSTQRENELLGETRDRLVDRAKDTARQVKQQAMGEGSSSSSQSSLTSSGAQSSSLGSSSGLQSPSGGSSRTPGSGSRGYSA